MSHRFAEDDDDGSGNGYRRPRLRDHPFVPSRHATTALYLAAAGFIVALTSWVQSYVTGHQAGAQAIEIAERSENAARDTGETAAETSSELRLKLDQIENEVTGLRREIAHLHASYDMDRERARRGKKPGTSDAPTGRPDTPDGGGAP